MKMRVVWAFLALALLGALLVLSCSSSESGDDDAGGDDDNDASDDDDDHSPADDDAADDDTTAGGTWKDPSSGLTWQVTPATQYVDWTDAATYCANLTLAGGGWTLPTVSQLRTLIRGCAGTATGGACDVTDSCANSTCQNAACSACQDGQGPNGGCYGPAELPGPCDQFWSNSAVADLSASAWLVDFSDGNVTYYSTDDANYFARCVRQ